MKAEIEKYLQIGGGGSLKGFQRALQLQLMRCHHKRPAHVSGIVRVGVVVGLVMWPSHQPRSYTDQEFSVEKAPVVSPEGSAPSE